MPKLKLKRTPVEEAAHQQRKQARREAKQRRHSDSGEHTDPPRKRRRTKGAGEASTRKWASSDESDEFGPQPGPSSPRADMAPPEPDYSTLRVEVEEQRFREKMSVAFEDDERLDSLEARFNDFAHVPGRWRPGGGGKPGKAVFDEPLEDEFLNVDPRYMDEEEYVEWIRVGMYRKTHAEEYADQHRKKALNAARRAEEKARKAETKRLEKLAEEERLRKKLERQNRRWDYAREEYDMRWKKLLSVASGDDQQQLRFHDIPWPILAAHPQRPDKRASTIPLGPIPVSLEHITLDAVSQFLLSVAPLDGAAPPPLRDADKKERKEKLRETFLRFHPDKFEGRFIKRIRESEIDAVREGIGQVVRVLNTLMGENT